MMRMNGLKTYTYYITHSLHFYALHIISSAVFLIAGKAFQMELFTRTQTGVLVLLFLVWGVVQIALAFFFATLFSKSRTALGR